MLKRVLTLLSVSTLLIVCAFVGYSMYLVFSNANYTFTMNAVSVSFIFAAITVFIALILTGLAYKNNNKKYLIIGSIILAISTIPNIFASMSMNMQDPFILTKLVLPSFCMNVLLLVMYSKGFDQWENTKLKEGTKSHFDRKF